MTEIEKNTPGTLNPAGLPPEFNDVEHFQSVARNYINREIIQDFHDLGDESWSPHIGTSRASMRVALTHKDDDSLLLTHGRMMLYYMTYGKAASLQAPIFGIPNIDFDRVNLYKPQIHLYFQQNASDVESGETPVRGEISFRLTHESTTTITEADVKKYAERIKANFATGSRFVWHKGKSTARYEDLEKGYKLTVFVINESEAKRVIEQVLDIQGHTPDWSNLTLTNPDQPTERYPNNPGNITILGKSRRKPKRRPVEEVRFVRASLLIHGLPNPITLVDTSGRRANAILTA